MAFTRGRCTNFDYCSAAEARRDIDVPIGQDFVCPECGKGLKAPPLAQKSGGSPVVPVLIGVGALVLVGGAIYLGMQMGGANKPTPAVAQAPAPAPRPGTAPTVATQTNAQAADAPLVRLRTSPVAGAGFGAKLAAAYLAQIGDTDVRTEPGASPAEVKVVGQRGDRREVILVTNDTASGGFTALNAGGTDIVITGRRIQPEERALLAHLGDMTAATAEHTIGVDGIAAVVNTTNPVTSLSKEQLKAVFSGTTRNWSEVGGIPGDIHLYGIADGSELASAVTATVLANTPLAATAKKLPDAAQVAAAVAADPLGIGVVDLANIQPDKAVAIADTGAIPSTPTNHAAVAGEEYPFAFRIYAYTAPQGGSAIAQRLVDYALSPAGQALAEQNGLVSQTLKPAAPVVPDTAAGKFKQLVAGAKRLAIQFHFGTNSTDLDPGALARDVDRVYNYMLSAHITGDRLILVGFADNQGDPASNLAVSHKRVDAVAALFVKRGVQPGKVAAFGSELPIADNSTEEGRDRNRRVEVYIQQ
jgi:phosphate transport system substrate-binding protein